MKYRLLTIPLLLIVFAPLFSCVNNSEEELYGDCDTLNMTYTKINYIFNDNCVVCHNESTNYHDIKLNTYSNVMSAVNTNKLLVAIKHTGEFKMPKDQPPLSTCQIAKIESWINAGMPE